MTPTDALIEKMARAIHAQTFYGPDFDSAEANLLWEYSSEVSRNNYRSIARAAYSAEHEEDGK